MCVSWSYIAWIGTGCLEPRKGDPRAVDTLIRVSERVAKLHGLDAAQRIEASGPNGQPIQTETGEWPIDLEKLTVEELLQLEALYKKAGRGEPPPQTVQP